MSSGVITEMQSVDHGSDLFSDQSCISHSTDQLQSVQDKLSCSIFRELRVDILTDAIENEQNIQITVQSSSSDHDLVCPICLDAIWKDPNQSCSLSCKAITAVRAAGKSALPSPTSVAAKSSSQAAPAALTPCGHLFHTTCIVEAMVHDFAASRRPHCPLCRGPLFTPWCSWPSCCRVGAGGRWAALVTSAQRAGGGRDRRDGGDGDGDEGRLIWRQRVRLVTCVLGICLMLALVFTALLVHYSGK